MLLQGSIRKFGLARVLQFLAQDAVTGVLEVRDFEEYGFVYLVEGRVEGISLPVSDEKLGRRLLKAGYLTEQQLSEALMEDATFAHDEKRSKPLGQRLVKKGVTSEARVREVMSRQTLDQVFELAHWQDGTFIYSEPEQMPDFQVEIQGDVPELLLNAQRRVARGEQSRKTGMGTGDEICHACPIGEECTPAIKAKHLKKDVCLWRKMGAALDDDYDRLSDHRRLYRSEDEDTELLLDGSIDW